MEKQLIDEFIKKAVKVHGGKKEFEELQKRDKIKTKYCKDNNIKLIRIKYNEDISSKLHESLGINKEIIYG